MSRVSSLFGPCVGFGLCLSVCPVAVGQTTYLFSIDWHGPTVGVTDPFGVAITEGDILSPSNAAGLPALGPLPVPTVAVPHAAGGLGLFPGCAGHLGGTPCVVEVDALSFGLDAPFLPGVVIPAGQVLFSVDEYGTVLGTPFNPGVSSETPVFDASADAYVNLRPLPGLGFAPFSGFNVAVQDGDGFPSGSGFVYPGIGIVEINPPMAGPVDLGDNVDALDVMPFPPAAGACDVHFSLDSAYFDPLEGVNHTGSAAFHGFVGGDVLVRLCGTATPVLYAPANVLGLDLVGGPDSDDLDALILHENGQPGFQVSPQLWSWVSSAQTDMLLFSVRRGSAVIGQLDSILGLPIEEGDLLVPPVSPGLSPFPGIAIPAESLGLATVRSGSAALFGTDLNAADAQTSTLFDCDGDGMEDAVAIALGLAPDTNQDGIPDTCQTLTVGTPFCFCNTAAPAPCGNFFPAAGCLNASATGALLVGTGSASVAFDNLVLTTTGMNPNTFALTIRSLVPNTPLALQNGLLCLQGTLYRFPPYVANGAGTGSFGPGIVLQSTIWNPPAAWVTAGQTWHFQTWYRDLGGPCGGFANFSNALSVTFTP